MPRTPRNNILAPDSVYHLIGRGNNKQQIFHDDEDYEKYMNLMLEAKTRHRVFLYHFTLMPNHIHFSAKPAGDGPSRFMHDLQMFYAQYYCRKYEFIGHVWQGRFKSLRMDSDMHVFACGNYIELNPVRAGLVQRPEDWLYSSYCVYAFGEVHLLVDIDPYYENFGRTPVERQKHYQAYFVQTIVKTPVP
ncbi:MAG: transposase [Patescibacteria group bacterium]